VDLVGYLKNDCAEAKEVVEAIDIDNVIIIFQYE
jgi:hypothetical protein